MPLAEESDSAIRQKTTERFGLLWGSLDEHRPVPAYHYRQLKHLLPEGHLRGWALDAGCGPGIDSIHLAEDGAEAVIGLEPSEGGIAQCRARSTNQPQVRFVRGCLENTPLTEDSIDFVYCYGVLHHLAEPERGFKELVRVLRPGGVLVIYVYEDFATRSALERWLLQVVARIRRWTVQMPAKRLYRLCTWIAPLVMLGFSLPGRLFLRFRWTRPLGERIPFRHATSVRGLVGDLYDRFAALIEYRYRADTVRRWFQMSGLEDIEVIPHRGWLAFGRKREKE